MSAAKRRIVVALTGASGVEYGRRLLEILAAQSDIELHLIVSPSAVKVLKLERGLSLHVDHFRPEALGLAAHTALTLHRHDNVAAPVASGSFRVEALAVVPCSMGCAAAISSNAPRT
jgi:4-hydroxy-3-polyprenylbenzoate decarboxylase